MPIYIHGLPYWPEFRRDLDDEMLHVIMPVAALRAGKHEIDDPARLIDDLDGIINHQVGIKLIATSLQNRCNAPFSIKRFRYLICTAKTRTLISLR